MLDVIVNNPFRVLGVYSSAKQAEILKNANKMKAYLSIGKKVSFPMDIDYLIQPITRTVDSTVKAQAEINLPVDKIKYSLFWFCAASPADEVALSNLISGNTSKAIEIFEKRVTFASILNLAVLSIALNRYSYAASLYELLIRTSEYNKKFLAAICDDTFQISEDELMHIVIDELLRVESPLNLIGSLTDAGDKAYVTEKALNEPIASITSEISKAKSVSGSNADDSLKAGRALIHNTKAALCAVRELVGTSHQQYQSTADNLAKQILQCGINYYNNSNDENDVENALELQQYALEIAVGKLVKDRCQQNVDILLKMKEKATHEKDIAAIAEEIKAFQSAAPSISRARMLVNNCNPRLAVLKTNLGPSDELYLKVSSVVANNALEMVIAVVNRAQKTSKKTLSNTFDSAIAAMKMISRLDMNPQVRSHFEQNYSTLIKIKLTYLLMNSSSPSSLSSNSTSETSSGVDNGSSLALKVFCVIFVILFVIFIKSIIENIF